MKRVTQGGDINFNVADVKGLGDNYAFRFYTTDSCKYIVKVDGDAVEDIIRLEWDELKTLGDGVLNYCGENLEPDEEYSDATFNRTFGGTTQWYIVTSCSGGGGGGSSEEISELSDRLDAEISRSTEKDEELEAAIDNTYTKAEVDQKIAEAEMGGDVPSGIVIDPNYVHTDNNYTTADRSKLDGIAAGAEVNVQADWNVTDTSSDAYIQHKPDFAGLSDRVTTVETTLTNTYRKNETYSQTEVDRKIAEAEMGGDLPENIVIDANYVHTDNNYTTADRSKLDGIAAGAEVNVQADWNVTDTSSDAYIQHKPDFAGLSNRVTSTEDSIDRIINQYIEGLTDDVSDLQNGTYRKNETYSQTEVDNLITGIGNGYVESVTVNGSQKFPDVYGDVNLGNLRGQDGNSGVASADNFESVNNLNGETTDTQQRVYVLGANQGKRLRDQIDLIYQRLQTLYSLLGNIAFWNNKPDTNNILPELDWGMPKHTVSFSLSLTNATVKVNGTAHINGDTILVEERSRLTIVIEPFTDYGFYTLPTLTFDGTSVTLTSNQDGSYSADVLMGLTNATLAVTATASLPPRVGLTMKKVTGYGAQFDTEGNYVPEKDDFDHNTIYTDGAYMTLGDLSSSTPECSLSNVNYTDGEPFTTVVNPSAGYSIFSVKVTKNSQDITDDVYNSANHTINVSAADSTLAITVIVSETTNSFFMGGSFFGVQGGIQTLFEPQKSGQIVTDPDWQCMSEFVPVPANATHVRWWLGDSTHKPYDETQTGPLVCQQRALIFYDENFVPGRSGTYYDITNPYRDYNMSTFTFTPKYVRASFKTSLLQYARIQFSSDGTNFTDAWVYTNN